MKRLIARMRERRARARAEAAAERYAALEQDVADARAEQDAAREWAQSVARGIYRDPAGYYVFSAPYLTDLAKRCTFISQRQLDALLRIATQEALSADGVAPLVVPLSERDAVRAPLLRLIGPEVA